MTLPTNNRDCYRITTPALTGHTGPRELVRQKLRRRVRVPLVMPGHGCRRSLGRCKPTFQNDQMDQRQGWRGVRGSNAPGKLTIVRPVRRYQEISAVAFSVVERSTSRAADQWPDLVHATEATDWWRHRFLTVLTSSIQAAVRSAHNESTPPRQSCDARVEGQNDSAERSRARTSVAISEFLRFPPRCLRQVLPVPQVADQSIASKVSDHNSLLCRFVRPRRLSRGTASHRRAMRYRRYQ